MTNWVDIADKTRLRAAARDLRRLLRETVVAAKANENILAALHEIALVLIAGDAPRPRAAASIRFCAAACKSIFANGFASMRKRRAPRAAPRPAAFARSSPRARRRLF